MLCGFFAARTIGHLKKNYFVNDNYDEKSLNWKLFFVPLHLLCVGEY